MAPETCGQLSLVVETLGQNRPKIFRPQILLLGQQESLQPQNVLNADVRSLYVRGPLLPCSIGSGQRERVGDHSVALGFERFVADSVGPGCGAYGLADSVAVPRVRLAWIGPVPVEECCLKFHVA